MNELTPEVSEKLRTQLIDAKNPILLVSESAVQIAIEQTKDKPHITMVIVRDSDFEEALKVVRETIKDKGKKIKAVLDFNETDEQVQ